MQILLDLNLFVSSDMMFLQLPISWEEVIKDSGYFRCFALKMKYSFLVLQQNQVEIFKYIYMIEYNKENIKEIQRRYKKELSKEIIRA